MMVAFGQPESGGKPENFRLTNSTRFNPCKVLPSHKYYKSRQSSSRNFAGRITGVVRQYALNTFFLQRCGIPKTTALLLRSGTLPCIQRSDWAVINRFFGGATRAELEKQVSVSRARTCNPRGLSQTANCHHPRLAQTAPHDLCFAASRLLGRSNFQAAVLVRLAPLYTYPARVRNGGRGPKVTRLLTPAWMGR